MVASVARNLVAGALGLQTKVSKEKREEERQKIKTARGTINFNQLYKILNELH